MVKHLALSLQHAAMSPGVAEHRRRSAGGAGLGDGVDLCGGSVGATLQKVSVGGDSGAMVEHWATQHVLTSVAVQVVEAQVVLSALLPL